MAQKVLILGDSGTGKSASLRNFTPEEVYVINVAGKPLPFKNSLVVGRPRFETLTQDVKRGFQLAMEQNMKVIVVDDAQYIMSFQYMRRIKENGWDKWNDIQGDFFNIIQMADDLPDDVVVYFLSHLQRDDEGHEKIKTMGKMLDEKITIEGLFTIVLKTAVKDGQYFFLTQNSGLDTVKSPIGMFPSYAIDNDLKYVDTKIRNYYQIGEFVNDEEVEKMDQEVKAEEIVKPDPDGRRRRRTKDTDVKKDTDTEGQRSDEGISDSSEPAEQPKRRTRKIRNGEAQEEKHEEAPIEEAKEEAAPKRRRRQRTEDVTAAAMDDNFVLMGSDEDSPF